MDYVEGQNLAELVGQQSLPPAKAADYVEQIAEAIHYAHERGVLHRDLKPSNVLIDSATDRPRVTDFGLAKRLDGDSTLTLSGQVLGSPNFMPPEQAGVARGKVGCPSDVYVARMNLAQAAWEQNNVSRAKQLLEETATAPERGFEWSYWQRQLHRDLKALRGHTGPVLAVAYCRDERRIASFSADGAAKIWDVASGKELVVLDGHGGPIRSVAFFPDSQRIVTGSWDTTTRVWGRRKRVRDTRQMARSRSRCRLKRRRASIGPASSSTSFRHRPWLNHGPDSRLRNSSLPSCSPTDSDVTGALG